MDNFISDTQFFNNDIFFIIEAKDKLSMLEIIKEKHKTETDKELIDKRNDLIIWNVLYTREIIKSGMTKAALHPIYNKFYSKIQTVVSLKELQALELAMASAYFDILISDIEVTDNFMINKILQYLHINIENHISLEKVAKDLHISSGYASSCFKNNMGISLMRYAQKIKIERAKTLLLSTDRSIIELADLLGFFDQSHFTRSFKKILGISPTEYRNKNFI